LRHGCRRLSDSVFGSALVGETDALVRLLRNTIGTDHYSLSRRVQMWKGILAKIRPEPPKESLGPEGLEPKREPLRTQTL